MDKSLAIILLVLGSVNTLVWFTLLVLYAAHTYRKNKTIAEARRLLQEAKLLPSLKPEEFQ